MANLDVCERSNVCVVAYIAQKPLNASTAEASAVT